MKRTINAMIESLGPVGFVLWACCMACLVGYGISHIVVAPELPPPITADWRCGLAPSDYNEGECGNPVAITFCVNRCPNE